jgi:hypothetical protein
MMIATGVEYQVKLRSTDQEMIPARNAIDARAHDLLVNDELLLRILKEFAKCTRS